MNPWSYRVPSALLGLGLLAILAALTSVWVPSPRLAAMAMLAAGGLLIAGLWLVGGLPAALPVALVTGAAAVLFHFSHAWSPPEPPATTPWGAQYAAAVAALLGAVLGVRVLLMSPLDTVSWSSWGWPEASHGPLLGVAASLMLLALWRWWRA